MACQVLTLPEINLAELTDEHKFHMVGQLIFHEEVSERLPPDQSEKRDQFIDFYCKFMKLPANDMTNCYSR
jgi:hypothetical protein